MKRTRGESAVLRDAILDRYDMEMEDVVMYRQQAEQSGLQEKVKHLEKKVEVLSKIAELARNRLEASHRYISNSKLTPRQMIYLNDLLRAFDALE